MGIVNKLIPLLEINVGSKNFYFSSQSVRHNDGTIMKQYEGMLKGEGGISSSFSLSDFKSSTTVSTGITVNNRNRLQDYFNNGPESFKSATLKYVYADSSSVIDDFKGIVSNATWDNLSFSFNLKDAGAMFFKNVPEVIFDQFTFQISHILQDMTAWTDLINLGDQVGAMSYIVKALVSSTFAGKPDNYWKGSRVDVIMDQRDSADIYQCSGQFGIITKSWDTTAIFNIEKDAFMAKDDTKVLSVINNTLALDSAAGGYDVSTLTMQVVKNAVPQNADSLGMPFPIIYGAPDKVPAVWSVGQKSTNTNSFGIGDDLYVFAGHKCKLGIIPDPSLYKDLSVPVPSFNNGVYVYKQDDIEEIKDGMRAEVYWSLEDKRVVDARISPDNRNWISDPFPKRLRGESTANTQWVDEVVRMISPFHKIKVLNTNKGKLVHAIQLRGGEFDWYDYNEQHAQFPIRYGMGNSKLYISTEGHYDDLDGFYTGVTGEFNENQQVTRLIKNPADIILHFLMNYTSIDENRNMIDIDSFRTSRMMLDGWRFDTAITEVMGGSEFVDRLCAQCCSVVFVKNGKFRIKTIDTSKITPKLFLLENEHIVTQSFEISKIEDIYNGFNFSYNYDYPNKKFASVIVRDKSNDPRCRDSYSINGFERFKPNIDLRDIQDEYTANKLADLIVDFNSKRRIYMNCEVIYTQEVIDSMIEIGDCVSVSTTCAPGGWIEKKCLVIEVKKTIDKMELRLMEV